MMLQKDLSIKRPKIVDMVNFKFFNDNLELYASMLSDLKEAKRFIYLETYMFNEDNIGKKFLEVLVKKAKEKLDVKIIIDYMGSNFKKGFFKELLLEGGKVKVFKRFKIRYLVRKNNQREHRKLLVIDDEISYIGSSNISDSCLTWRESNLRVSNTCGVLLRNAFLQNFYLGRLYNRKKNIDILECKDFYLVRDVPSIKYRLIRKEIIRLIASAKSEVLLETPYFLPDRRFRKEIRRAASRGVEVCILLPKASDVKLVDILRQRYFGRLHRRGIKISFYRPSVLHSKMVIIDRKLFGLGSSNLDYRSAILQFEIMIFGKNKRVVKELRQSYFSAYEESSELEYKEWKSRGIVQKLLERLLIPLRYWF